MRLESVDELGSQDSGINNRQVSWIIPLLSYQQPSLASDLAGRVYALYSVDWFSGLSQLGCSWSSVKESEITTILL